MSPSQTPKLRELLFSVPYSFLDGCNYEDHEHEDDLMISPLLVGNLNLKPHLPLLLGGRVDPKSGCLSPVYGEYNKPT